MPTQASDSVESPLLNRGNVAKVPVAGRNLGYEILFMAGVAVFPKHRTFSGRYPCRYYGRGAWSGKWASDRSGYDHDTGYQ